MTTEMWRWFICTHDTDTIAVLLIFLIYSLLLFIQWHKIRVLPPVALRLFTVRAGDFILFYLFIFTNSEGGML